MIADLRPVREGIIARHLTLTVTLNLPVDITYGLRLLRRQIRTVKLIADPAGGHA
ncbi:MAG: hypothetical protein M3Z27_00050 [Actinomycetota bacterium]|nr:hypothetical protein [Actinomycetota bacterium]